MIVIAGHSEGFQKPSLRKVKIENSYQSNGQELILSDLHISSKYNKKLSNPSKSETFLFNSDSGMLTDGDLIYIHSEFGAFKIYDVTSNKNTLFLTDKCNCNCLSCPQPPLSIDTLPWVDIAQQIIRLIDVPPDCLGITGGEPTIIWDSLLQILQTCSEYLPNTSIQLLSNGRFFSDFNKVIELKQKNSNIILGIPLNSDVDELHDELAGRKGAFWETVTALHNLARCGIPIELRIVISKANYKRLPELSEFIYRNLPFVSHVAFMALEPIGRAADNFYRLWINPVEYQSKLLLAVEHLWQRGIQPLLFNFQLCMLAEPLRPLSLKTISDWKVRFAEECAFCTERQNCGGFFFSALPFLKKGIKAIRK